MHLDSILAALLVTTGRTWCSLSHASGSHWISFVVGRGIVFIGHRREHHSAAQCGLRVQPQNLLKFAVAGTPFLSGTFLLLEKLPFSHEDNNPEHLGTNRGASLVHMVAH